MSLFGKRTAILLDENGTEIYRGDPLHMPIRFVKPDFGHEPAEEVIFEVEVEDIIPNGGPVDDDTDDPDETYEYVEQLLGKTELDASGIEIPLYIHHFG